jgi:hypothetical protein
LEPALDHGVWPTEEIPDLKEVDMEGNRNPNKNWKFAILLVTALAAMCLPTLLTVATMNSTVASPDWTGHIWPVLIIPALWTLLIAALAMLAAWALGMEKSAPSVRKQD